MAVKSGTDYYIQFDIPQTQLLAGTPIDLVAQTDGYIAALRTDVDTAVTTGGTINVKTGDALAVTVAGLQQTIANGATKGTRQLTTPTKQSPTRAVAKGDRIAIVPASFATAGALKGYLHIVGAIDNDGVMPFPLING